MAAGYRLLPEEVKHEIDSLDGAPFVFGAVRAFSRDWHSERLAGCSSLTSTTRLLRDCRRRLVAVGRGGT